MANANLKWAWVFGTETEASLDRYWRISSQAQLTAPYNTAPFVRTYDGAAGVRRSIAYDGNSSNIVMDLPAEALVAANEGGTAAAGAVAWSFNVDTVGLPGAGHALCRAQGNIPNVQYIDVQANNSFTTVRATSDGVVIATSSSFDLRTWNWFAFFYDQSTTTHKARVEVNGVEVIAESTRTGKSAQTVTTRIFLAAASASAGAGSRASYCTDCAVFDAYGSTVPVMFVDRYEPTADGTNSGTWSPSAGTLDYAVVDSPYDDSTTFVENTSPSSGHYVEVESADDIATQFGITPTEIYGVVGYCAANGANASVDVRISDNGVTFDNGTDLVCDSSPKFGRVASPDRPSDAADWSGTDTITFRIQVA